MDLAERELLSRAEFDGVCLRMERKMQVILFPKRLKARLLRLAS